MEGAVDDMMDEDFGRPAGDNGVCWRPTPDPVDGDSNDAICSKHTRGSALRLQDSQGCALAAKATPRVATKTDTQ